MKKLNYEKLFLAETPDALIALGPEGEVLYWNSGAVETFGYTSSEALGRSLGELIISPNFVDEEVAIQREALEIKRVTRKSVRHRKDGSLVHVDICARGVRDESNGLCAVLETLHDLTEQIRREETLKRAYQRKGEFLASMSHELRTPLNGILGFTEFLADEKPGPMNPKQKEYLKDVHQSAVHLLQLINDVLDLAKIETGKVELHSEEFSPAKAIEEVCAVVKGAAHKKRVKVTWRVAPELRRVMLDQQKFKQVCFHLLANAVKFTGAGGKAEIVASRPQAGRFEVRVTDTGIGLKKDDLQRLRRAFDQPETGEADCLEGIGLGLALTKELVKHQGGGLGVQSEYGQGSTFSVVMPTGLREVKGGE